MLAELKAAGVPAAVHYPLGAHAQPCFATEDRRNLPVTEALSASLLSLPIHHELSLGEAMAVVRVVAQAVQSTPISSTCMKRVPA